MTIEDTPELHADLPDLIRMIARMPTVPRLGSIWRELALAISDAGEDIDRMAGLVAEGEVYNVRWEQQWAPCACKDGKHRFTRDGWFGRLGWMETRADAEKRRDRVRGHLLTRLIATTSMEVVQ